MIENCVKHFMSNNYFNLQIELNIVALDMLYLLELFSDKKHCYRSHDLMCRAKDGLLDFYYF